MWSGKYKRRIAQNEGHVYGVRPAILVYLYLNVSGDFQGKPRVWCLQKEWTTTKNNYIYFGLIKDKREISQIKMFNPKNKSYYMNFKHKNKSYRGLNN